MLSINILGGPMPFVPASGVARVELIFLQHGQRVENVYHVRVGLVGPLSEAQLDAVRLTFENWRVASLRSQQSGGAVLQQIEVRDMTVEDGLAKVYPCTANCPGSRASTATPGNVTVAVKWTTGFAGRSRRGRTYHIGFDAGMISGNQVAAAFQTSLQAAYQALITACNTATTPLVVYSRVSNGLPRVTALITPITNASVEVNLDSMRRRLTGPGRGD